MSILLSGILLKMGAYGLVRVAAILSDAVLALQLELAVLALVSFIYGGLLAWRQTDLKVMIAYSSVSHMGVVLLGIATLNVTELSGALIQMLAHGPVAGALYVRLGNGSAYRCGRDASASIGLVPGHSGTGGHNKMTGITKRGDKYLRALMRPKKFSKIVDLLSMPKCKMVRFQAKDLCEWQRCEFSLLY